LVFTVVAILAAIIVVVVVVVTVPVIAVDAIIRAAVVGLATRAWHQGWQQRSRRHVVGVEHCRSSNRTRGVLVDFLQ
jgi:hypothetical protein